MLFSVKIYKYFIGCLCDGKNIKPLNIMLPKTSAYVKSCDGQTKWMYFLIGDDDSIEEYNGIYLFGTKSVLIPKRNLIASLSMIKII